MSRPRVLASLGVVLGMASAPAEAAPVTWADPAGLCNGQVPCFTTFAAAVANAGPGPAAVFLFPGTYAESVDLSSMGSAIGSGPGVLGVASVDASGQVAPGAVVDSGAPGGPGTGPAVQAVSFPAALVLDGLVLRSPDSHGLLLPLAGAPVRLRRLVASGNPGGHGVLVLADPAIPSEVEADDLRAEGNGSRGVVLVADRVVATDVTARNNGEEGIALGGREVIGDNLVAEGNGATGVAVTLGLGAASFELSELTLRGNATGLTVLPDSSATASTGTLTTVAASGNDDLGVAVFGDSLVASNLAVSQNENGILFMLDERIEASGLGAVGNAGIGIAASAPELRLTGAVAEDNVTGIALDGDLVVLEGSTALGSGPVGDDPHDGTGFVIAANRLEATSNLALGNVLGWRFEETDPLASLLSDLPAELVRRRPRPTLRGAPLASQRLILLRTRTEANLAAAMEVRLRPEGSMQVACSNFIANGQPGFDLQTPHTVDARFNFWGNASGPLHPRNPGGTGDPIQDGDNGGFGTVLFGGVLADPATDADCPAVAVQEVPALGPCGLLLLAALLAGLALRRL